MNPVTCILVLSDAGYSFIQMYGVLFYKVYKQTQKNIVLTLSLSPNYTIFLK